ncbi:MAG: DNA mismatch repair endonuclease MutL, partial [Clostridia bacterium]|nr:DNA mismatch repair endonuclease MutL [Clostridia bacterium]
MPQIKVLDKHVAELIAAGEVVERPASVIKELVENSIDAGATQVTVEIQNGGVSYMRVTDNGCGISRNDVPTAFLRHATSKVSTSTDLDSISTLGFRGEALASVAAVARVEMMTCKEGETGVIYKIYGGEEISLEDAGCPVGTTIIVRDLFYNTPARMKFLKKDVGEANAVAGVLDKIALSHPEISVRFIRDGKNTLNTPGDGDLKAAIYAVFGRDFASGLIKTDYTLDNMSISGYIGTPVAARANRNMQHFYINGRYVKSKNMIAAVEQAYKNSIMVGKFPSCVLNLNIPFNMVDINVSPSKTEARFVDERAVFNIIYYGVKTALNSGDTRPELKLDNIPVKKDNGLH